MMRFWPTQFNFALYCATTACGLNISHLNHPNLYVRSIFQFQLLYHTLRALEIIKISLPGDDRHNFHDNFYSKNYFNKCVSRYDAGGVHLISLQFEFPDGSHDRGRGK